MTTQPAPLLAWTKEIEADDEARIEWAYWKFLQNKASYTSERDAFKAAVREGLAKEVVNGEIR